MILLIPFERKINWRKPPVVTILLVLVNVCVYFIGQSGDVDARSEALSFYFSKGMHKLEMPRYADHLQRQGDEETAKLIRSALEEQLTAAIYYLPLMLDTDGDFRDRVIQRKLIPRSNPGYAQWLKNRERFESKLQNSLTVKYGFRSGDFHQEALLVHMFLHASVGHLLGNMLFLFLVGFLVEGALGWWRFLLVYLLCGVGSIVPEYLLQAHAYTYSIGASGAISGVMGLFAALFGLRKVQFFYLIFVYFSVTRAPAVLMLFPWLGWEIYQQVALSDISNVNYLAHIGGFVSGVLLAWILTGLGQVRRGFLDAGEQKDTINTEELLAQANNDLSALLPDRALAKFNRVLAHEPGSDAALVGRTEALRFKPSSNEYHAAVHKVLSLPHSDPSRHSLVLEVLRDYLKFAKPKASLPPKILMALAHRAQKNRDFKLAKSLVRPLVACQATSPQAAESALHLLELLQGTIREDARQAWLEKIKR